MEKNQTSGIDLSKKRILTINELSLYTGIKKSYLYQLVRSGKLPYSRPNGKVLFFDRLLIDEWILSAPGGPKNNQS